MAVCYHPDYVKYDFGTDHPLHQNRVRLHYKLSQNLGILDHKGVIEPKIQPATEKQLQLVHEPAYIDLIRRLSEQESYTLLDDDTHSFPGVYDAARLLVGGSIAAADNVMKGNTAFSWNPGGGMHHAHSNQASGFCIFNDASITCRHLQKQYKTKRILYLDIDVHHADGVQSCFYHDPSVLTLSIHETGRTLFPNSGFTEEVGEEEGRGYSVNLPLPPYTQDKAYLEAFEAIVPPILEVYRPDVIVMQNGVDTHFQDPLGHLALTTKAFENISEQMRQLAKQYAHNKLVALGGGGYSYLSVPRCWTIILGQLIGIKLENDLPSEWQEYFYKEIGMKAPTQLRDDSLPLKLNQYEERIERLVHQSVLNVKQLIFPLLGIEN